jgi:hypothetical protein
MATGDTPSLAETLEQSNKDEKRQIAQDLINKLRKVGNGELKENVDDIMIDLNKALEEAEKTGTNTESVRSELLPELEKNARLKMTESENDISEKHDA